MQFWVVIINQFEFFRPPLISMHLIYNKILATHFAEDICQFRQPMRGEIEILRIDVKRTVYVKLFFDVLEYHRGLPHAPRTDDAHQTPVPIHFVIHISVKRGISQPQQPFIVCYQPIHNDFDL